MKKLLAVLTALTLIACSSDSDTVIDGSAAVESIWFQQMICDRMREDVPHRQVILAVNLLLPQEMDSKDVIRYIAYAVNNSCQEQMQQTRQAMEQLATQYKE